MACGITRPNPQTLFDRCLDMMSVEVLGGSPIIPESNEWYVSALNFAMMDELWSVMEQQWKERDPRYACCDNLIAMAALDGIYPSPGKAAQGYAEITGDAGARLPSRFAMIIGEETFESVSTLPARLPASGKTTVRVRANVIGSIGNSSAGADLTGQMTTEITGVNRTVTIKGGSFCGGEDAETCEQFRTRYLARMAYTPRSRSKDIEELILSRPCVTRICERGGTCCNASSECGCKNGCTNSVHYYVFFDDTFDGGLAPQCVLDEMNTWLFGETSGHGDGEVDIGVCGSLHTATAVPITVQITGLACRSASERTEIQTRIGEVFRTFCPSSIITRGSIEAVVYQVIGNGTEFEVDLILDGDATGNAEVIPCGDVELACDYAATLAGVDFADIESGSAC